MFHYEPVPLYNYVTPMTCETKKNPVQVSYPTRYDQTTIINLPQSAYIKTGTEKTENDAFIYKKQTESIDPEKKKLTIKYSYLTKTKEIGAKDFYKVCNDMNELVRDLPLQISYPKEYKIDK